MRKKVRKKDGLKQLGSILKKVTCGIETPPSLDIPYPKTKRIDSKKVKVRGRRVSSKSDFGSSQGDEPSASRRLRKIDRPSKTSARKKR